MVANADFDMLRPRKKPSKKSKKGGAKGSDAILKESTQLGCASRDSYPRKSILREPGRLGSKHAVKFSTGTWHQIKIRERNGPSRGIIQKCAPHESSPCAPKFEERSHEETLIQEGCARRAAWNLAKNICKLENSEARWFRWRTAGACAASCYKEERQNLCEYLGSMGKRSQKPSVGTMRVYDISTTWYRLISLTKRLLNNEADTAS